MSVLLQISDTHFGTEQEPVVTALLELAQHIEPEVVVLSGDVTQRARRAQFAAARDFADRLPAPVLAIPGNHDIPLYNIAARMFAPYENYARAFGDDLEPQFESAAFLVLCVNTTRPARHKDGEISTQQIERIAARLRQAPREQLRIVVIHQPVLVIRPEDERNLLHGHEAAVRAWSEAGADIVMGGHIHLPYIRPLLDPVRLLPRRMWAVQAGTALSWRIRGSVPNSVNIVRHPPGDPVCSVERWDFEAAANAFRCIRTERLDLDRNRLTVDS
jgi:3',5'-cyclic AMP phosphodiesterase CpdA